mmetsp:Transcript_20042/g.41924  ORF Transcript_20042/g.41924 Transcript_20042/m.41924 type:complete len:86 (-) Transcript_20042:2537-2794(-)
MYTVAISVEDRAFKLLRSLVKLFDDGLTKIPYKDIYRASLTAKMGFPNKWDAVAVPRKQEVLERLKAIHSVLQATDDALSKLGLK